jgi:hypothetical protein
MPTLLLDDMKSGLWKKVSNFRAKHATNRSFQKLVNFYQPIHHHTTEGSNLHNYLENPKSDKLLCKILRNSLLFNKSA